MKVTEEQADIFPADVQSWRQPGGPGEAAGPAAGWASQLLSGTLLETPCVYQALQPTLPAVGGGRRLEMRLCKGFSLSPRPSAGRGMRSGGGEGDRYWTKE